MSYNYITAVEKLFTCIPVLDMFKTVHIFKLYTIFAN